jgi:Xaa-Pro dipeptidase
MEFSSMTHPRVQTLFEIVKSAGVDAIALIPGANLQYVIGLDFHLMERPLVVFFAPGQDPVAVAPTLEQDRLAECGFPVRVFAWSDAEGYHGAFAAALAALELGGKRLGVEELRMRVLEEHVIEEHAPTVRIVPAGDALADLRLRKDDAAIASLRQAIRISQDALDALLPQIHIGMTEREIAGLLVVEQLKRGGGKHPFEPIVSAGPRSALPHGEPSERQIAAGEALLFDFGTTANGYASDITRTFAVGEPSARLVEIYEVVKAANAAGRAAAKPGIFAQDVDRATRRVIEDAGFGAYFTHRTGHGLGLEAHERPNMVEGNTQILEPGMVFTVEPGIYIPGEVGVRIEDNVVITADGAESLTTYDRELRVIG